MIDLPRDKHHPCKKVLSLSTIAVIAKKVGKRDLQQCGAQKASSLRALTRNLIK